MIAGLMLLASQSASAASGSGNVSNTLSLGGQNQNDNLTIAEPNSQAYFTLFASSSQTSGHYNPLVKNGTNYQVTSGSSFHVISICYASASTGLSMSLMSATAAFSANAGTVTGEVNQGGVPGNNGALAIGSPAYTLVCVPSTYVFSSATYPGFTGNTSTAYYVSITGKETTP